MENSVNFLVFTALQSQIQHENARQEGLPFQHAIPISLLSDYGYYSIFIVLHYAPTG